MYRIFIVEDDKKISRELSQLLNKYGYECRVAEGFENVVKDIADSQSDLVLLDINLPMYDGFHICRELRKQSDIPIIIVTSRDSEIDELMSMNLGADDFVTKPYNTQILIARIDAVLKRVHGSGMKNEMSHNGLGLNIAKGSMEFAGNSVDLTKNELHILMLLMKNAGQIVTRDELIDALWQTDEFIDDNTLTVNVTRLRSKLAELGLDDFIVTRRGQGYTV